MDKRSNSQFYKKVRRHLKTYQWLQFRNPWNRSTHLPTVIPLNYCTSFPVHSKAIELNLDQNRIKTIAPSIAKCPRLKVLRIERNQLTLEAFPEEILSSSQVSSLSITGNLFQMRDFYTLPSYAQVRFLLFDIHLPIV